MTINHDVSRTSFALNKYRWNAGKSIWKHLSGLFALKYMLRIVNFPEFYHAALWLVANSTIKLLESVVWCCGNNKQKCCICDEYAYYYWANVNCNFRKLIELLKWEWSYKFWQIVYRRRRHLYCEVWFIDLIVKLYIREKERESNRENYLLITSNTLSG